MPVEFLCAAMRLTASRTQIRLRFKADTRIEGVPTGDESVRQRRLAGARVARERDRHVTDAHAARLADDARLWAGLRRRLRVAAAQSRLAPVVCLPSRCVRRYDDDVTRL